MEDANRDAQSRASLILAPPSEIRVHLITRLNKHKRLSEDSGDCYTVSIRAIKLLLNILFLPVLIGVHK